jgi:hypothetical protein
MRGDMYKLSNRRRNCVSGDDGAEPKLLAQSRSQGCLKRARKRRRAESAQTKLPEIM